MYYNDINTNLKHYFDKLAKSSSNKSSKSKKILKFQYLWNFLTFHLLPRKKSECTSFSLAAKSIKSPAPALVVFSIYIKS